MITIIYNTTLITLDPERPLLSKAAIVVEDDHIIALGPSEEMLDRFPTAKSINGEQRMVVPGFANCHTHATMTIARGIYEDLSPPNRPPFPPFSNFGRFQLPKLSPEEGLIMAKLGALEMIRSGTTVALIDEIHVGRYAKVLSDSGLRLVLSERVSDRAYGGVGELGSFEVDAQKAKEGIERTIELHRNWHGAAGGRITISISAHAPDMCSPELLKSLREIQERLNVIATIHLNQFWGEVTAVKETRGMLPTHYLKMCGFLNPRLIAAHCRCMTPEEIESLGVSKVFICFNSAIAARRGLTCPARDLESAGCTIVLGSDNMSEDMVEVTRTALFMERVRLGDGRFPMPEDTFRWATENGYRALGIGKAGALKEGYKADLIMIHLRRPHLVPNLRILSSFVHNGQAGDVEAVMVDGCWLMRDQRVLTMDEEAILNEADRVGRHAWHKLAESNPDLKSLGGFRNNLRDE
jgi:5-methylthioadenosine/S-adenosylhomocysteine deaminase